MPTPATRGIVQGLADIFMLKNVNFNGVLIDAGIYVDLPIFEPGLSSNPDLNRDSGFLV